MKHTIKTTLTIALLALYALIAACTAKPVAEREPSSTYGRAKLNEALFFDAKTINSEVVTYVKYDLKNQDHLAYLEHGVKAFLNERKRRKDTNAPEREQWVGEKDPKKNYLKFDFMDSNLKDSAEYIADLFDRNRKGEVGLEEMKYQIAQISRAIFLNYTIPVRGKYEFFTFPVHLGRFLSSPSVSEDYKGQDPDLKFIRDQIVQEKDISKIDFAQDYKFKPITGSCQYDKAKRGYGVHAGFHIKCGDMSYKMKFGNEEYSGPFNSRIYRSLGYITPHINYYESMAIDYDRRMLLEFNERLAMSFKVTFIFIPVFKKSNKEFINPFSYIKGVKMKDGTFVDAATAQARLIKRPIEEMITADMIDANFESQISQVIFKSSSLTLKDDPVTGDELGPWIPDDFNYRDFKEIRGIMVLAAWTGNFDIRKDNLRLMAVTEGKGKKNLRLTFGDAGSGLGDATGVKRTGSSIDDMKWEVSAVYEDMNNNDDRFPHEENERIELSGIGELEHAKAFSKIKITDAHWMLNKLCQFTPEQIKVALVSSGLSSAEALLAQGKLIERRNKMMQHFKYPEDQKAKCFVGINRKFNYDPAREGLVTIKFNKNSEAVAAPDRGHKIVNGRLIKPADQE